MQIIKLSQLKSVINHVVMEEHEPIMVVGPSGAGKTEVVEQAAEEHGAMLVKILLGQYDTVDLKGSPWVMDIAPEGSTFSATVWHPATTLPFKGNPRFPIDRPIFLFLDELTSATVPVMGICYQLTNERRIGEFELMDNVEIICAGNREQDKGIVNRMPMPLNNRLTHFEVAVDVDGWCKWAQNKGLPPVGIAFMQFRKPLLHDYDPAKPAKVFASPRTWRKALKYYASTTMPHDVKLASMAGAVGEGPANEFWGFVTVWQQVGALMKDILQNPTTAEIPSKADMQFAVAISLSGSMTKKNTPTIYAYLKRMSVEFMVVAWQMAINRDSSLFETNEFLEFTKKYKVVFEA